jgi:hypothetical protein
MAFGLTVIFPTKILGILHDLKSNMKGLFSLAKKRTLREQQMQTIHKIQTSIAKILQETENLNRRHKIIIS